MDTCTLLQVGSPIRTSAGHRIFAPNRSFSQLVTSFIGSQCQGIRLMLLITWPIKCLSVASDRTFIHYCYSSEMSGFLGRNRCIYPNFLVSLKVLPFTLILSISRFWFAFTVLFSFQGAYSLSPDLRLNCNGGEQGARTPDPLRARQVLSQLS